MSYTVNEVLEFVADNDVKFVRLAFFDIFGTQKNISILADELPSAFDKGVNLDIEKIEGFDNITNSELYLFPDANTLSILPWRPQHGRVVRLFCDIKYSNGEIFECDVRNILRKSVKRVADLGFSCNISTDCEFYLFETDNYGHPTKTPQDTAGYLDIAPLDKGENVRRQICLTLEEMEISPLSSHHECGPGQNQINFKPSTPLKSADHLSTFKTVVKAAATSCGLFASFMPKPLSDKPGSSLIPKISLRHNISGINIFEEKNGSISDYGKHFVAGVLNRIGECTMFCNPIMNSYARLLGTNFAQSIDWSDYSRKCMVRLPKLNQKNPYMELLTPDPSCNHYLVFALILSAGCEGIMNREELQPKAIYEFSDSHLNDNSKHIPNTLSEALKISKDSEFLKLVLPVSLLESFINKKHSEIDNTLMSTDIRQAQDDSYFNLI